MPPPSLGLTRSSEGSGHQPAVQWHPLPVTTAIVVWRLAAGRQLHRGAAAFLSPSLRMPRGRRLTVPLCPPARPTCPLTALVQILSFFKPGLCQCLQLDLGSCWSLLVSLEDTQRAGKTSGFPVKFRYTRGL